MNVFIFDVDGTLTPPRQQADPVFAEFFQEFCHKNAVFLISGSDYGKIQEQLPQNVLKECFGVFSCSGAEYHEKAALRYSREHRFSEDVVELCKQFIADSPYPHRYGQHLEFRTGMLNVSVVGRAADLTQRHAYYGWDRQMNERKEFAEKLTSLNLGYEISCGGEISLDIVPLGWNKSVAKKEISSRVLARNLIFFGDRIMEGGNDMPLAEALAEDGHMSYCVDSFHDTWKILLHYQSLQTDKKAA